jgi:hypothetical protein
MQRLRDEFLAGAAFFFAQTGERTSNRNILEWDRILD